MYFGENLFEAFYDLDLHLTIVQVSLFVILLGG
jgi:hypothetical protein